MDILPSLRAVPTIEQIAEVLLSAPADVPWSYEGRCRHTIRRTLILVAGMAWKPADREARRLVANGRLTGGIRVPTGFDHNDIAIWI